MDLGTSAPHIHIHSDGDDLSIRRLHLIFIESLRTMKSCHPIKSQKVRNSYLVGSRRVGGKDLRDKKSVPSEGRFRVLLDSWKRKTISYAEGLFLHTRCLIQLWGPLGTSLLLCSCAYSASSLGSCSFCALVRAPARLALGAQVGVAGPEKTTRACLGSVVIV
jgi:hypothetical protein